LFQVVLNRWDLAGITTSTQQKVGVDAKGQPTREEFVVPRFRDEEVRRVYEKVGAHKVAIPLRSPKQIIDYLGRLAALQLFAEPPYVAKVPVLGGAKTEWVALFRVGRGESPGEPIAVSVDVGALGRYYVPQPDILADNMDYSVRIMTLVIELQNLARQEAPIQGTGFVVLQ
jgi:hypothetical protein